MNIFNLSINVDKINKETSTMLRVLKNIKHKPTTVYKTQSEKTNERKQNINKNVLKNFRC